MKKKILYYLIGSVTLSLGIELSVLSAFGAGAYDAMNANLSASIHIQLGLGMLISVFAIYVITMLIRPRAHYIIGALLSFLTSFEVMFWDSVIPNTVYFPMRVLYFGLALILLPFGITCYMRSRFPLSPVDNLVVIVTEITKRPIALIKTILETTYAVTAAVLGLLAGIGLGSLSLGTIIITFTIGPGIGVFMKLLPKVSD
jgi:uncharacterized membrane protein YczE